MQWFLFPLLNLDEHKAYGTGLILFTLFCFVGFAGE